MMQQVLWDFYHNLIVIALILSDKQIKTLTENSSSTGVKMLKICGSTLMFSAQICVC
jgi:hypothetical protein